MFIGHTYTCMYRNIARHTYAQIYIHVHMHICKSTSMCAFTHSHIYVCTYMCLHTYAYIHVSTSTLMYATQHTYTCIHTYTCTHINFYIYVHAHSNICMNIHIYVYAQSTYICSCVYTYIYMSTRTCTYTCTHMYSGYSPLTGTQHTHILSLRRLTFALLIVSFPSCAFQLDIVPRFYFCSYLCFCCHVHEIIAKANVRKLSPTFSSSCCLSSCVFYSTLDLVCV